MWRELFTRALAPASRARVNNSRRTSLLPTQRSFDTTLLRSRIPGNVNNGDSQRRDRLSINLNRLESPFLQRIQRVLLYLRHILGKNLRAFDLAFRIYHDLKYDRAFTIPVPRQFWRFAMYPPFLQFLSLQSIRLSLRIAPERLVISAAVLLVLS